MRHLLAKLELEGISIFSFKAVTRRLTEKIGLFPWGGRSAKFRTSHKDLQTQCVCLAWCVQIHLCAHADSK